MPKFRWRSMAMGLPLVLLALMGWGAWYFFPIELQELQGRYGLWKGGVTDGWVENLHFYERNHCATGNTAENPSGCTCVALIHGRGDSAFTWRRLLLEPKEAWRGPVRVVALDLPGSGASPPPLKPPGYRVRNQAASLKAALSAICPKWTVVGNSLGGWIAAWLAIDWPQGVDKLVEIGAAGLLASRESSAAISRFPISVEDLQEFQRRAYHSPRPLPANVWNEAVRRLNRGSSRMIHEVQKSGEEYLDERLSSVRAPTLLLWGLSDRVIPIEQAQTWKSKLPRSELVGLEHCGHLPQKECEPKLMGALNDWIFSAGARPAAGAPASARSSGAGS